MNTNGHVKNICVCICASTHALPMWVCAHACIIHTRQYTTIQIVFCACACMMCMRPWDTWKIECGDTAENTYEHECMNVLFIYLYMYTYVCTHHTTPVCQWRKATTLRRATPILEAPRALPDSAQAFCMHGMCVYVWISISVCICMYVYIYIYTHTHIYIS